MTNAEQLANAKIAAAKITPAKVASPKAKTSKKIATKAKTTKPIKKTVCPVCVNGRGEYANISKHNKKHHGGRTPEVK